MRRAHNSRLVSDRYRRAVVSHLFIKSVTGNPPEYASLEKVFVSGLLDDVSAWILQQVTR